MEYMNKFISSLQDHGFPVNPVSGVLYDSLQDHGIPANPIPGRLYCPIFPILP